MKSPVVQLQNSPLLLSTTMSSRSVAKAADVLELWYNLLKQEEHYLTELPRNKTKLICRSKLITWMYNLVDSYSLDRDLVAIAASYMDRYISKTSPVDDWGYMYQQVGITSLYLALKIYRENGKFAGVSSFASLSRGLFTEKDIIRMEIVMLNELEWSMHPPTVHTFSTMLLAFIPRGACSPFSRRSMFERIKFLLELCITVPFFIDKRPSNIAIGAFMEIMESEEQPNVSTDHQAHFKHSLYVLAGVHCNSDEVAVCRDEMKNVMSHQDVQVGKKKNDSTSTTVTP